MKMSHRIIRLVGNSASLRLSAVALMAAALSAPAHADFGDYGQGGWGISSSTLQDMIQADMMNRSLRSLQDSVNGPSKKAGPKAPPRSPLDVSSGLNSTRKYFTYDKGVIKLATLFPREEFIRRKNQISDGIIALDAQVATSYGIPKFNLATAHATAIAGAYAAYHGKSFPDAYVKPLVAQLQRQLAADPAVTGAAPSSKSYQYQINMGPGLLLMGAELELRSRPNANQAAQLRTIGGNSLRSMFGVDASRVEFSAKGYTIR